MQPRELSLPGWYPIRLNPLLAFLLSIDFCSYMTTPELEAIRCAH